MLERYRYVFRWAELPQRRQCLRRGRSAGLPRINAERLKRAAIGTMCVVEHRAADRIFANDCTDTRKRNVKPCGIGKLRCEETKLHLARVSGFGRQSKRKDRGSWRMRFEIEMDKFDPELPVIGRKRGPDGAAMWISALEKKEDCYGPKRERSICCARCELFKHRAHHEQQRFECLHWRIKFHKLFQQKGRLNRHKQMREHPYCQLP